MEVLWTLNSPENFAKVMSLSDDDVPMTVSNMVQIPETKQDDLAYQEGGTTDTYKPTDEDIRYVAATMAGEALNQPEEGIYGVGHVINNRFKQGNYKSYKDVVTEGNGRQFNNWMPSVKGSSVSYDTTQKFLSGKDPRAKDFYEKARKVLNNEYPDPTNGARFFYNPSVSNPEWGKTYKETAVIGQHRFMHPDQEHPTKGYEPAVEDFSSLFKSRNQPQIEDFSSLFKSKGAK